NTFVSNTVTTAGFAAAIAGNGSGVVSLVNNIFSNNRDGASALNTCDTSLSFTSLGLNLSDAVATDCSLSAAGELTGVASLLGPLQSNGGPTSTMALLPGSPAIGHADASKCPATDQRGASRPIGGPCDIGAFQSQ